MIYCHHYICVRLSLFSDTNVSQGSVATFVRCGGIFNADFIANFLTSQPVKELWNRPISDEVIVKVKRVTFLRHSVLSQKICFLFSFVYKYSYWTVRLEFALSYSWVWTAYIATCWTSKIQLITTLPTSLCSVEFVVDDFTQQTRKRVFNVATLI